MCIYVLQNHWQKCNPKMTKNVCKTFMPPPLETFTKNMKTVNFYTHKGHYYLKKLLNRTQNQACPRYYYQGFVQQISFQYVPSLRRKLTESVNKLNFSTSKEHYSLTNCSIVPKIKLDLVIIMINLYIKFHFNM